MKKLLLILLLLSGMVIAGRVGLVVQFDGSSIITKCVTIPVDEDAKAGCNLNGWCNAGVGDSTVETVLSNSGLRVVTGGTDPCFGRPLCKIEDAGCDASNCFCSSSYWGFFYLSSGSWQYAECGISGFNVKDGDVLGFRWGNYGSTPEVHTFDELCPSSASQNGIELPTLRYFEIETRADCSGEATFTAEDEGVYSYGSPDHLLNSFVVTNVIKAAEVSLERAEVPEHQEAGAAPSAAMAVANPSPTIIGVGAVIILALLYLLKEVRK